MDIHMLIAAVLGCITGFCFGGAVGRALSRRDDLRARWGTHWPTTEELRTELGRMKQGFGA